MKNQTYPQNIYKRTKGTPQRPGARLRTEGGSYFTATASISTSAPIGVRGFTEDMTEVRERPARLGLDAFGHFSGCGVDRKLSRNIERTAGPDGLRIGTHGLGRMG